VHDTRTFFRVVPERAHKTNDHYATSFPQVSALVRVAGGDVQDVIAVLRDMSESGRTFPTL
jgi:hypothetical protein